MSGGPFGDCVISDIASHLSELFPPLGNEVASGLLHED